MTVDGAMLPFPNSAGRCPSAPTRTAETHFRSVDHSAADDNGDDTVVSFVSPLPLITRIFPGL
jgi:hypothetical protein